MSTALASPRRDRLRLTAVMSAVVLVLATSAVVSWLQGSAAGATWDGVLTGLVICALTVVGAVIALAAPGNKVGSLLLVGGLLMGLGQALTDAGVRGVIDRPGSVWGATYLAATGPAVRAVGWVVAVVAVPALVPTGRLPSRGWRWLGWCVAGGAGLLAAGIFLMPRPDDRLRGWRSPLAPAGWDGVVGALSLLGAACVAVGVVGAVSALIVRWWRGDPLLRQQMLLLASAAFPPALVMVLVLVLDGLPPWAFDVALLPLPVAIAAATLQHGLYDLRRAAHRSLLWLLMSGVVVAVYVVVVVVIAALVPERGEWWLPGLAAAAAALSLVPLRESLQRGVNRVVYGRWHEPYEVLAGLGSQLEGAGDIDRLLAETVAELRSGLDLREVCLRDAGGVVVSGAAVGRGEVVPLVAYGTTVGALIYEPTDRPLSTGEQRLLRDLAGHLGAAMHARQLRDDLLQTRERLVRAREEERRRLRRDLHDGVGPALAGLRFQAETTRLLLPPGCGAAAARLEDLAETIRSTVVDVRRLVEGLRPPALDELGLVGACEQAVVRLTEAAPVRARLSAPERPLPALPAAVEVAAYRIVVEAVTNVVRHSGARRCAVTLDLDADVLTVDVADDGAGLDGELDHGNGLSIMRERAEEVGGTLVLEALAPGTRVQARLPASAALRLPAAARAPA